MAKPKSREEFKQYCLRKIGAPVNEINVADEQLEDRIDEALSYFADYHYSGSEDVFFRHKLTKEDIEQRYIDIPEEIISITGVFDVDVSVFSGSGMFNANYQFVINNADSLTSYRMQDFVMHQQHISLMRDVLGGATPIRYNRNVNKLYLDLDWSRLRVGSWIVAEVYKLIDGMTHTDVWSDRWLQNYASVLIKEQWGINLTKFSGMMLPGNVTFNGDKILDDATTEKRRLEDEMLNSFSLPATGFIG